MKKTLIVIVCLVLAAMLAACSAGTAGGSIEGSLEDIMAKVYEGADTEQPDVWNIEINDENKEYYFGTADIEYKEAISSDAMINAVAHSICLLRLNNANDAAGVMEKLKANANPNKWICVGVEEEDVIVDSVGDLVIFIMAENAEAYHESFKALAK